MEIRSVEQSARRRIAWRFLPFVFLLYVMCYVDRVNVSFANLGMSADLGFSDRVFGLGAGIFFVGYVLFEIPGAVIVERWSARRWIGRIMVSWGIVTILTGFVQTAQQFYAARLVLGVAEASFFPGMVVYLTHWFCVSDRAKAIGSLYTGVPAASVLGSALGGWLLNVHWLGMAGWRWLFVVEGIPPLILGVITFFYLTDRPREAKWLPEEERKWITEQLAAELAAKRKTGSQTVWQALVDRRVWLLIVPYFLAHIGAQGSIYWLPTFVKRISGLPAAQVALLVALPGVLGMALVQLNGWHSDKTGERKWHVSLPILCAGAAYLLAASSKYPSYCLGLLILGGGIFFAYYPVYWTIPTLALSESGAAAAFGLINSVGHCGGFVGPSVVGQLNDRTGGLSAAFFLIGICDLVAGTLLTVVRLPAIVLHAAPVRSTGKSRAAE